MLGVPSGSLKRPAVMARSRLPARSAGLFSEKHHSDKLRSIIHSEAQVNRLQVKPLPAYEPSHSETRGGREQPGAYVADADYLPVMYSMLVG